MSLVRNMNKGTDTNYLEQFCIRLYSYNNKSYRNKILESVIHNFNSPMTFNYNIPTRDTQRNTLLLPPTFISLQYCANPCLICKLFLNYQYVHICTTIVVAFKYLYTLMYLIFIFIFVLILILQNNQNSMLLYKAFHNVLHDYKHL